MTEPVPTPSDQLTGGTGEPVDPRPVLDPHSAAALALNNELDKQLLQQPDTGVPIAMNPAPMVDAVFAAVGDIPRVPRWIPGETRRIGGATPPGATHPEPEFSVEPGDTPGTVRLALTFSVPGVNEDGSAGHVDVTTHVEVDAEEARRWGLNVMSAADAAPQDDPA